MSTRIPDIHSDNTVRNFCAWLRYNMVDGAQAVLCEVMLASLDEPLLAGDMLNRLLAHSPHLRKAYWEFVPLQDVPAPAEPMFKGAPVAVVA